MTSNQRIKAFSELRSSIGKSESLKELIRSAESQNPWFTPANVEQALQANLDLLTDESLREWLMPYSESFDNDVDKSVGLVLAGNIPMVGFHDVLSCLIAGFSIQLKLSSSDKLLIPFLLNELIRIEPRFAPKIKFVDRLAEFDLIIATGSNNTSRYFEYYFSKVPHVIRKNRNSVAIISGNETTDELKKLGYDIFDYFGLGCRNVSKLYFPQGYNYAHFFEGIEVFSDISNHFKYNNNYDYNKAIYLVNGDKHLDNGFLLLKEDTRIASPLAVVYYEEYADLNGITDALKDSIEQIQCVVSNANLEGLPSLVPLGESQKPGLSDYADGVNILDFLKANR